jgi:hypothetical protein
MSGRWSTLLAVGTPAAAEFQEQLVARIKDEFEVEADLLEHVMGQMRSLSDKASLLEDFVEVFDDAADDVANW